MVFASFKVSPSRAIELGDEEANIYAYRANAYGQNPDSRRYVSCPDGAVRTARNRLENH